MGVNTKQTEHKKIWLEETSKFNSWYDKTFFGVHFFHFTFISPSPQFRIFKWDMIYFLDSVIKQVFELNERTLHV